MWESNLVLKLSIVLENCVAGVHGEKELIFYKMTSSTLIISAGLHATTNLSQRIGQEELSTIFNNKMKILKSFCVAGNIIITAIIFSYLLKIIS